ncbi:HIT family protein [Actinomadura flavalba]|uniref:HIT family protein n=1 Tax=Actinomadura flavalba TaxID=1120938 RepID=UPI0003621175|nr:HIT family protein [Actinomadura flavalba]
MRSSSANRTGFGSKHIDTADAYGRPRSKAITDLTSASTANDRRSEALMADDSPQETLSDRGDVEVVSERGADAGSVACVFCKIIRGEIRATVVDETDDLISFLDHRPLFHGHTLLVPKLHVQVMSELPADRVLDFFTQAQRLERAVETGLGADGSMILINNVVSQSVPHLHLHVIPRRKKDGLRFWLGPRHPYTAQHPAEEFAERIRTALKDA